ncbi:MAG: hemin uptake protein HemP [Rhodoferax sp.]|nr:hemin uptake protein HemP [Rhodoferax sp.]MBP7493159.1 hemin uptake protein HemP [Rhodoferax sp.]
MSSLPPSAHLTPPINRPNPSSAPHAMTPPVQSSTLFKGGKSVSIEHHGEIYRLQTTKLGKLILTK